MGDKFAFRMWGYPYTSLLGAALMLAALITTLFTREFRPTLIYGIPFLLILTVAFYLRRTPAVEPPAIENPGNVAVIEVCENLAFLLETLDQVGVRLILAEDLERYGLAKRSIVPQRQEDRAHTAFPQPAAETIGADHPLLEVRRWLYFRRRGQMRLAQRPHFGEQIGVAGAFAFEEGLLLAGRKRQSPVENIAEFEEKRGFHKSAYNIRYSFSIWPRTRFSRSRNASISFARRDS